MLSRVAGHYQGAYPIPELMKLTFRELMPWYKIMSRENVENNIINNLAAKRKPTPTPPELKRMVDKKLREYERELSE